VATVEEPDELLEPELLDELEEELEPELELLELEELDLAPELEEEPLEPELLLPELLELEELDLEPELEELEPPEPELEPLELEELDLEPELLEEELLEPELLLLELDAPELELDEPPLEELEVTSLGLDLPVLPVAVTGELEEPTTEPDVPVLSAAVLVVEVVVGIGVVVSSQALRPARRKHTPNGTSVDLMLFRVIVGSCKKRNTQKQASALVGRIYTDGDQH
jgi:hypothetical protein